MSEEITDVEADVSQAADAEVSSTTADASEGVSEEGYTNEAPSFAWDDWDGSVDSLPEEHRDLGSQFHNHYDSRLSEKTAEYDGLRELYDAMMSGQEDPRVARLTEANQSFEERYKGLEEKFDDYRSQVEAAQAAEAKEWADRFEKQHADLLGQKNNRERMVEFLDGGWDADAAIQLLTMDEEFVQMAEEAKGNGVPDSYAIRLAEASAGKRQVEKEVKATPRPGARITAGATGAKNPQQAIREIKDTDNLEDRRMIAARAALKAVKGGQR
jgi:hypothetical protein